MKNKEEQWRIVRGWWSWLAGGIGRSWLLGEMSQQNSLAHGLNTYMWFLTEETWIPTIRVLQVILCVEHPRLLLWEHSTGLSCWQRALKEHPIDLMFETCTIDYSWSLPMVFVVYLFHQLLASRNRGNYCPLSFVHYVWQSFLSEKEKQTHKVSDRLFSVVYLGLGKYLPEAESPYVFNPQNV